MLIGRGLWRGFECEIVKDGSGAVLGPAGRVIPPEELVFLPPTRPSKIVCVGRNYMEHARELGNTVPERPLIFLKPPSSLIASGDAIVYPSISDRVDFEGELGVIIGKRARHVKAS